MIRANLESITGKPWVDDDDAMGFFLPYKGANADPALAARFRALAELPEETFGHTFAVFYLSQKYAFPGEEQALNFKFATPHDSSHILAGYDTTPRGELLVSTFTAAMHRNEAMSGHVLPVLFSWHLGIALNEVAGAAKGALDPQEFWHAWARGEKMKVDLFGPSWDFWAATREPIESVRARRRDAVSDSLRRPIL
jgi:ubiquinone biosynthesis protein Coq4